MSGFDNVNETTGAVTAAYSVTANDYVVLYDTTGGAFAITLPAASSALAGREYVFVQKVSSANQMTLKTAGGTINGVAAGTGIALTASKIGVFRAVCDGTNWWAGGGTLVLS